MEYIKETEEYILSKLRDYNLDVGDDINGQWFLQTPQPFIKYLSEAFENLKKQGIFDANEQLTEKGYNRIYNILSFSQIIQETEEYILSKLRDYNLDVGDDINGQWFLQTPQPFIKYLSEAFENLKKQGIFDADEQLTEKGYNRIYNILSLSQIIQETEEYILSKLRDYNLDVGDVIDGRWFIETKQPFRKYLSEAFENLKKQGIFDANEQLTEKGYDRIYS